MPQWHVLRIVDPLGVASPRYVGPFQSTHAMSLLGERITKETHFHFQLCAMEADMDDAVSAMMQDIRVAESSA